MTDRDWHAFMELTVACESLRYRARALATSQLRLLERAHVPPCERECLRREAKTLLADLGDVVRASRACRPEVDILEVTEALDICPSSPGTEQGLN